MPILLTGGGEDELYHELNRKFVAAQKPGARLCVVPTAADPEDYPDILDRMEQLFGSAFKSIDLLEDLSTVKEDQFSSYDSVYIDGGNTFDLIEGMRESALPKALKSFDTTDNFLYGDSAGAIVLGCDMSTAYFGEDGDDNDAKMQAFHGLSLLQNWSVHCHYAPGDDEQCQDFLYSVGSPLLCLAEETGIWIDSTSGELEVFGERSLVIFDFTGKESIAVRGHRGLW